MRLGVSTFHARYDLQAAVIAKAEKTNKQRNKQTNKEIKEIQYYLIQSLIPFS